MGALTENSEHSERRNTKHDSRALGRAPCFGLPTNAGGERINPSSYEGLAGKHRPAILLGSLALLGTRECECSGVADGVKTKPRRAGFRVWAGTEAGG